MTYPRPTKYVLEKYKLNEAAKNHPYNQYVTFQYGFCFSIIQGCGGIMNTTGKFKSSQSYSGRYSFVNYD